LNSTFLEDIPSVEPRFDFSLIARALAGPLSRNGRSAVVVGIHGPWGSGKSTLLGELRRQLQAQFPGDQAVFVDFNAWKFQEREALWRALILRLLAALRSAGGDTQAIAELERSLYQAFVVEEKGPWSINWRTLAIELFRLALQLIHVDFVADALKHSLGWLGNLIGPTKKGDDQGTELNKRIESLASVLERTTIDRQVQRVESIEQFLTKFSDVVSALGSSANGRPRKVFVLIDDLDRCLPDAALEIFEAIKLFLDAPGCSYVVAVDREVIRKGLSLKYGKSGPGTDGPELIDPDQYIEKTIALSYDLPRLSAADACSLIADIELPLAVTAAQMDLIVRGIGVNPRRVKRFMNMLGVQLELARLGKDLGVQIYDWVTDGANPQRFDSFLKFSLIGYRSSTLFAAVLDDPSLLDRLQRISNSYRNDLTKGTQTQARAARTERVKAELPAVQILRDDEGFWTFMAAGPNLSDDPALLKTLSRWFRSRPEATAGGQ
jgi:hypothetical protein